MTIAKLSTVLNLRERVDDNVWPVAQDIKRNGYNPLDVVEIKNGYVLNKRVDDPVFYALHLLGRKFVRVNIIT